MQVPSNMLLTKIGRPAAYLSACMVAWVGYFLQSDHYRIKPLTYVKGILCACSGVVHNFAGLLVTRFLLGFVEAAFYPGALATLSAWYVRSELGFRTGLFYSGSMLSGAFSGL